MCIIFGVTCFTLSTIILEFLKVEKKLKSNDQKILYILLQMCKEGNPPKSKEYFQILKNWISLFRGYSRSPAKQHKTYNARN